MDPLLPPPGIVTAKSPSGPPKSWMERARTTASPWAVNNKALTSGVDQLARSAGRVRSQRWTTALLSWNATRRPSLETVHGVIGSTFAESRAGSPGPVVTRPCAVKTTGGGTDPETHGELLPRASEAS